MNELLEQALKLPVVERVRFADELYVSVGEPPSSSALTDAQIAELERRIDYHLLHPADSIPWKIVRDEAVARR